MNLRSLQLLVSSPPLTQTPVQQVTEQAFICVRCHIYTLGGCVNEGLEHPSGAVNRLQDLTRDKIQVRQVGVSSSGI